MSHPSSNPRLFKKLMGVALVLAALLATSGRSTLSQEPIPGGLEGGTGWINSAGPIRLQDLHGKVVLLDFWTYCCINCHHVLPDLSFLEEKYKNELVVIGVHTPKFPAEHDTDNLRQKVAEYKIKHPVINDANQALWTRFGVNSWPTLVLITADGKYFGAAPGEGHRELLDVKIGELVEKARSAGILDTRPFVVKPESEKPRNSPLNYPGKVLADAASKRLFISDTSNHRIVITDLGGTLIETVGTGQPGRQDGSFAQASFNRPQGTCLVGDILYVADTENHEIRALHLKDRKVETVAGIGSQSYKKPTRAPAKTTGLSSPWDLTLLPGGDSMAVAMAGTHQIWKYDIKEDLIGVWAGDSSENITDGFADGASFAQPSGLASDGKHLFVADSEGSCVRTIALANGHKVSTLVGQHDVPGVLFSFGDIDGESRAVRLQHCLGLAYNDGNLYIADTYNNKIKVCDPAKRTVKTLAGTREGGTSNNPAQFNEPGGLSVAGSTLYVADTNNHAIRAIDLKTNETRTLKLSGVTNPEPPRTAPKFSRAKVINMAETRVTPGSEVTLEVALTIPSGYKLNAESPLLYLVETPGTTGLLADSVSSLGTTIDPPVSSFSVKIPLARPLASGEAAKLKFSLAVFSCKTGSAGFCTVNNFVWNVPIIAGEDGAKSVPLSNAPKQPE